MAFIPKSPLKPRLHGIPLKKQFGQHFLHEENVLHEMCAQIDWATTKTVVEIGCGDGFLTGHILTMPIERLIVFEIDPEWASYVRTKYPDKRLEIIEGNILDEKNAEVLSRIGRFTVLANLPYNVTFPILHILQKHRHSIAEGVIMVQDEVAAKITKTGGRGYGYPALFFQHYFSWKLLSRIAPDAFVPPPAVNSRLLYFTPLYNRPTIINEEAFWKFIGICFKQPRRTLKNNLAQTHYNLELLDEFDLKKRAQQLSMADLLRLWSKLLAVSPS